jgi:protein-L-isoaspartate(D-aspartate) O-methyltransferase
MEQLAPGGRLVIPVGNALHQTLTRVTLTKEGRRTERMEGCIFVPLVVEYGWKDED